MLGAAPKPVCLQHYRLLREYAIAVSECNRVHSAQLAALLKGQDFKFENEIAMASARRQDAKYAILAHQDEHG